MMKTIYPCRVADCYVFASIVTRAYGRKPSILLGGAAFIASAALNGAAVTIYMLIFRRVLLSVCVGFANQACVRTFLISLELDS